jgi:FkbM family methyltransferase
MGRIRDLARNRIAVAIVRFFRLGFLFKFLYFRVFHPKGGTKTLEFNGIRARFYALNYEGLNTLDTILIPGAMDERLTLAALLDVLKPGDVALDIGAYHGLHSVFMAKKVGPRGKVIAIEPDPKNYESLQANIRLNDLPQVLAFQMALGDKIEDKSLFRSPQKTGASFSLVEKTGSHSPQSVQVVPGDFLLSSRKLPGPKAVKIDVEGYEYLVLEGLKKTLAQKTTRLVCCEIHSHLHPDGVTPDVILGLLKRIGFSRISTTARGGEIHAICTKPPQ